MRSNSNQIIKDLLEKDPLIKDIIERERNFDEVPEINEYEFTLLSNDELNKLDLIDLSLEEKIQFIKEILSLSKEERKKLIDEMLENKD